MAAAHAAIPFMLRPGQFAYSRDALMLSAGTSDVIFNGHREGVAGAPSQTPSGTLRLIAGLSNSISPTLNLWDAICRKSSRSCKSHYFFMRRGSALSRRAAFTRRIEIPAQ
jgi:hypothetical protein